MKETESHEPTRFAWMRDGLLVAGTLGDYAKMWESDHYAGDNDLTTRVLTWDGEGTPAIHNVRVKRGEMNEFDYIPYTISVPATGDSAIVNVDGRA